MKNNSIVTPWEVSGNVDYEKLIKEFGVEKINDSTLRRLKKHTKNLHFMLRRKIFFAGRDINWILDEFDKGNKFFLYTGRAPGGPVHLGHLMIWIFTKWLQDMFDCELWFQFPNEEKVLFNKNLTFKKVDEYMYENMADIIALGFNPKKTKFIIDTQHADLMYKPACEISKKITFNMVKSSFGMTGSTNIGSIFYTSMQAVPAILPSILKQKNIPCIIPHAIDQDPHFRITRDILPKLGYYKPASIQCVFLPPLSGTDGKMSSSKEYSIYTTDDEKTVKKKINKYAFSGGAPTLEEHRKKGGNPDIDVCFQYLRMLLEDDDKKLEEIYKDYKKGKLLTGDLKKYTIEKINKFLKEHQKKREKAKSEIDKFIFKNQAKTTS
ncbi:tryptophan--tRNA ligase [Candidatus Pacearchaeota archaeon]|nr:tryptophan--tRNA ligase [Candidatus Pacearchaeota archaeon]